MEEEPQIPKHYAGKKILVTGTTGFIGKVLIWKLLNSCPLLDTIYVIIRKKYGKSLASRKEDLFNFIIFDDIKKNKPELLDKVVFIAGDVGEENLGLSSTDREILQNDVSIVFHSAAILKMDAGLEVAVNINTVGTIRMLSLASEMKKLETFLYISTTYCCCENKIVEEKIYFPKQNPHDILQLVKWMPPEMLKTVTPQLISPLPNTYTYSKRLTESILVDYQSKIPLIIARPTIVIPGLKEPIPGWNDNLNGPTGLIVAGGKGVFRASMTDSNSKPNLVPVDVVVDTVITLPWANTTEQLLKEISVYNIGQTNEQILTWKHIVQLGMKSIQKYPFSKVVWYPSNHAFQNNVIIYKIRVLFLHWLLAYVIDFFMILFGQKTFMVRVHTKLQQGENVLRYFARREWTFITEKVLELDQILSPADKKIFKTTTEDIVDYQTYMDNIVFVIRKYFLKEEPKNHKLAILKHQFLKYLDWFVKAVLYGFLIKWFYSFVLFVFDLFAKA